MADESEVLFIDGPSHGDGGTSRAPVGAPACSRLSTPCLIRCCRSAWVPANCKEGVLTIATVNLIILAIVLAAFADSGTTIDTGDLCQSKSCITLAAALAQNMNTSVDPCDDFYEYACGGWISRNPIPDDQSRYSAFAQLREQNHQVLRRILDAAVDGDSSDAARTTKSSPAETATEKAVAFYASCMHREAIETDGTRLLKDIVSKTQFAPSGGVSSPIDAPEDRERFALAVVSLHAVGIQPFFRASAAWSATSSSRNVCSSVSTESRYPRGILRRQRPFQRQDASRAFCTHRRDVWHLRQRWRPARVAGGGGLALHPACKVSHAAGGGDGRVDGDQGFSTRPRRGLQRA